MPFGLDYAGQFDSFNLSSGLIWVAFTFIYLFCFSYFALRGKEGAFQTALIVTILSLGANIALVFFEVSAYFSLVAGIVAYLIISVFVSNMNARTVLKVSCIITVNYIIAGFVPDYLGWAYDIFLLYIFYLISENRIKKEKESMGMGAGARMPMGM